MTVSANTHAALVAIFSTLFVVALGIGGFALGRSERTSKATARASEQSARTQAFAVADAAAYTASWSRGHADGLKRGERRGVEFGTKSGRHSGTAVADQHAAAARAAAPSIASSGCPSGTVPNAYGGAGCVPNSQYEEMYGGTSVKSPEGKRILEENPECQAHGTPPPEYTGPVQC
jgi:hypothetical protein